VSLKVLFYIITYPIEQKTWKRIHRNAESPFGTPQREEFFPSQKIFWNQSLWLERGHGFYFI